MKEKLSAPCVSIILTAYNREVYLKRCLDSVLNQSFVDWEVIAIDDGSTDNTLAILRSYEKRFPGIRVFSQKNIKLPLSRNRGIKESKGKYLTFLDSDDRYTETHLEQRVNFMSSNPDVDLIHGGIKIIGSEYVRDKNNPSQLIHLSDCTVGATFFGKRLVFINLKGFKNIEYSEDSEFLERAEKIFNVQTVDFKTYIYHRDIPDSITNSYAP